jgi:hypothetical protein
MKILKIFYFLFINISFSNKKTYPINKFYNTFWPHLGKYYNQITQQKINYFQHLNILNNIGKFKYSNNNNNNKMLTLLNMENLNISISEFNILDNFSPITFIKKFIKIIKYLKSPLSKLLIQKNQIKSNKNKILARINWEFQQIIIPYQNKIFHKKNKLNNILLQDLKIDNQFIGQKRHLKNQQDIIINNNQNQFLQQENQLFNLNKTYLLNKSFIFNYMSYNCLIVQEQLKLINDWKFLDILNIFSINWGFIKKNMINNRDKLQSWQVSININPMKINKNIIKNSKKYYKKIQLNHQQNVYNHKNQLQKKNYQLLKKKYLLIKKYRKESLNLINSFDNFYKDKYKSNFYNKKYYYEFLITKYSMIINYIKLQQNFIEFQWKLLLKTPMSLIKL